MSTVQHLLDKLKEHLALPWPQNVSERERVVMVAYPPGDERRMRRHLDSDEPAREVRALGHGWVAVDVATAFSEWLAANEYAERLLHRPERLWDDKGNVKGLEELLLARLRQAVTGTDSNTVLALVGCGGLFGLFSISTLIEKIADQVPGRLVVFFPGEYDAPRNAYRLLGAKDGWGYLAVPITA